MNIGRCRHQRRHQRRRRAVAAVEWPEGGTTSRRSRAGVAAILFAFREGLTRRSHTDTSSDRIQNEGRPNISAPYLKVTLNAHPSSAFHRQCSQPMLPVLRLSIRRGLVQRATGLEWQYESV